MQVNDVMLPGQASIHVQKSAKIKKKLIFFSILVETIHYTDPGRCEGTLNELDDMEAVNTYLRISAITHA